ncbi:MAG: hypothetical protein ACNA8W_01470, partial [Bradymonadaceae bacterium]
GVPNVGRTSTPELTGIAGSYLAQGISLTTMGFGTHYDDRLMAAMADEGGGNYHFINDSSALAGVFSEELDTLLQTVARATTVVVELGPDLDVDEVYGFPYQRTGQRLQLSLAEFHTGQSKNILLKLRSKAQNPGPLEALKVILAYDDLIHDTHADQYVAVNTVVTNDATKVEEAINRNVIARVQEVEVARTLDRAVTYYEQGNRVEAQKEIAKGRENVKKAQRRFKLPAAISSKADAVFAEPEAKFQDANSPVDKNVVYESRARGRSIVTDSTSF